MKSFLFSSLVRFIVGVVFLVILVSVYFQLHSPFYCWKDCITIPENPNPPGPGFSIGLGRYSPVPTGTPPNTPTPWFIQEPTIAASFTPIPTCSPDVIATLRVTPSLLPTPLPGTPYPYPDPAAIPPLNLPPCALSPSFFYPYPYPAQQSQAQSTPTPMNAWPTLEPIDPKSNLPISPTQVADYATYVYERRLLLTQQPQPIPTPPSVPIFSLADLPQAIYNLPIVSDNSCIQAKNPGPVLPVKSLTTKFPDYYLIPFFLNNKPCAKIVVTVKNGRASIPEVSHAVGDVFPGISAEMAGIDVTQKTGLQVKDQPILVYGQFYEASTTLTNPCWQLKTTDGQVYYVFFVTAMFEGNRQVETKVTIMSQGELHLIQ